MTGIQISSHGINGVPVITAYEPVQKLLALGSSTGGINVFVPATLAVKADHCLSMNSDGYDFRFEHPSQDRIAFLAFAPSHSKLVAVAQDNVVALFDLKTCAPSHWKSMVKEITACELPFMSRYLMLGFADGTISALDVTSGEQTSSEVDFGDEKVGQRGRVVGLRTHPKEPELLLVGFSNCTVLLCNIKKNSVVSEFRVADPKDNRLLCIDWNSNGKEFLCGFRNGSFAFWSSSDPKSALRIFTLSKSDATPVSKLYWVSSSKRDSQAESYVVAVGGFESADTVSVSSISEHRVKATHTVERCAVSFSLCVGSAWQSGACDPLALCVISASGEMAFYEFNPEHNFPEANVPGSLFFYSSSTALAALYSLPDRSVLDRLATTSTLPTLEVLATRAQSPTRKAAPGVDDASELLITGGSNWKLRFWELRGSTVRHLYGFDLTTDNMSRLSLLRYFPAIQCVVVGCVEGQVTCVALQAMASSKKSTPLTSPVEGLSISDRTRVSCSLAF